MTATAVVIAAVIGLALLVALALFGLAVTLWPIAVPVIFGLLAGPVGVGIGIIIVLLAMGLVRPS